MNSNVNKKLPLLTKMILSAAVVAGTAGISYGQPQFQIGQAAGGGGGGGRGGGVTQAPVNASSDARTNTVVVSGPADQMEQILKIIHQIDENPAIDNVVYVYKLKNGSALNVEAVANLLFSGTGGNNRGTTAQQTLGTGRLNSATSGGTRAGGGAQRGGAAGGGLGGGGAAAGGRAGGGAGGVATAGGVAGQAGAGAGLAGQVSVIADPNTNSLLVSTAPENWPRVRLILDELDRSVPQVLIKVLIAEVTHDNSTDIGADLQFMNLRFNSAGELTEGTRTGSLFGSGTDLTQTPPRGGFFQIAESQFSATIRALQATGKLDVLSRPYILASDNQLASINIGQQVPYVTGSVTDANGGITNSVTYAQVGVLLDVIPHINPDGMVILDVAPEVSALLDSRIQVSTGVFAPVFSTRTAQTRVAVENGQTIVIGGLMQDQKQSSVSKVPILGDIPWIGPLFQDRHETKSKTELLIFLTPHVAQRPDQLQTMGEDELNHTKLTPNAVSPGTFQEHMQGMKAAVAPPTTQQTVDEPRPLMPTDQQSQQLQGRSNAPGGRAGTRGTGARGLAPNGQSGQFGPGPAVPPPIDAPVPGGQ